MPTFSIRAAVFITSHPKSSCKSLNCWEEALYSSSVCSPSSDVPAQPSASHLPYLQPTTPYQEGSSPGPCAAAVLFTRLGKPERRVRCGTALTSYKTPTVTTKHNQTPQPACCSSLIHYRFTQNQKALENSFCERTQGSVSLPAAPRTVPAPTRLLAGQATATCAVLALPLGPGQAAD